MSLFRWFRQQAHRLQVILRSRYVWTANRRPFNKLIRSAGVPDDNIFIVDTLSKVKVRKKSLESYETVLKDLSRYFPDRNETAGLLQKSC